MTADDFRRLALGMTNAIEQAHHGHPDFRIDGRIFATIQPGHQRGMVVLTPEDQQRFVDEHPGQFEPESGAWGRQGCTRVHLAAADGETVGEAVTLAWQYAVAKNAAPKKRSAKKRSAKKG